MNANFKNIAVTLSFVTLITGMMLANIIAPDKEFSFSERRLLAGLPDFSADLLFDGKLAEELEKYFLDQFILRDGFRSVKAFSRLFIFGQMENNNLYLVNDGIYKLEYPLDEKSVLNAAKKLNDLYDLYLQGMNVYYAIVPDKNFFIAAREGYPAMDYDRMLEILHREIRHMDYIDLFSCLSIGDYYRTDHHWSQDRIVRVADKLLSRMGAQAPASGMVYVKREIYPFYGSYHGQLGLPVPPDTMAYLTNKVIENAVVYDHYQKTYERVYAFEMFYEKDPYDIFLAGARPLLTIENPACAGRKELILFRDSFGSSIAPLLLPGYSRIILADLRYISTAKLAEHIDLTKKRDVLFLYSAPVINTSWMLK
ncbi:MAG TPA: DHHW family protein [Bacillota bacterium]|nr:DHHW family protein [Bacillota bacterium]HOL15880.1 DHHW family protein [Bacillota bacterium]